MGKSKGGKSKGNVSQGIHSNVSKKIRNDMRNEYRSSPQRILNQMKALSQGKDVVFTIENPNKEETNKRFIKKRISGKDYIKRSKNSGYRMKQVEESQ